MRLPLARMLVAVHASLACAALVACATGTLPDQQGSTKVAGEDGGALTEAGADDARPAESSSGDAGNQSDAPSDATPDKTTAVEGGSGALLPLVGEIVVSEVLYNPAGVEPAEEWFELYNTTALPKLLSGLILKDGSGRAHAIPASPALVIAPSSYFLLVHTKSAAVAVNLPGAALAYEYGDAPANDVQLTNGSTGAIFVLNGTTQIAQSNYGPFAFTAAQVNGVSIELKTLTNAASLVKANWCLSTTAWPGGNGKGTPSAANDCP
jgi:hypothetical protein